MAEVTYLEAVLSGMREEMRADPRVFLMGEDVNSGMIDFGGTEFGRERVRDTPICETGFFGAGVGAALTGMRPIVVAGTSTFLYSGMDQIVNQAAKSRYMFGGQANVSLVICAFALYNISAAAHHCDRPWGLFAHVPGLKIVVASTPFDAKGLMKAAIRDGNPVLWFGDVTLLSLTGYVPDHDYTVPLGRADVKRSGIDLTIVGVGGAVRHALATAERLQREHSISAEVIDLRSIAPLDQDTLLDSVTRTGRLLVVDPAPRTCGIAAEVAATVGEHAFHFLKSPVARLTAPDLPVPFSPALEPLMYPTPETIFEAALKLCKHLNRAVLFS